MITFQRMGIIDRIKCFWPTYLRQRDAKLREAIRELMEHPELPCIIGDKFIPDGYGGETLTADVKE